MASLTGSQGLAVGFVSGAAAALLLVAALSFLFMRTSDVYGLGHWKLNVRTPLPSMWMNVGYWKKEPSGERIVHFDEAAASLLRKVLSTSGLLDEGDDDDHASNRRPSRGGLAVLDLGFGCGDQTWELARLVKSGPWKDFRYVGLTLNDSQVHTASRKVYREVAKEDTDAGAETEGEDAGSGSGRSNVGDETSFKLRAEAFQLFRADAARPATWTPRIREAVASIAEERFTERWLLALDCLYHFSPSRRPVFEQAARQLDANVMAFDLLINEAAPRRDIWIARAVGVFMGCPVRTFLTEAEYREQLVKCGYDKRLITVQEITEDVFAPLVEFLDGHERALGQYGISLGGFKLAARLFRWFAESRVVKAVIVVARTTEESNVRRQ